MVAMALSLLAATAMMATILSAARPRLPEEEAYPVFWAVGGNQSSAFLPGGSVDVRQWGIKPNNWTQCGGLTAHWPTLDADMRPMNGGVPQAVNLTSFLAKLGANIDRLIPDSQWSGLGVFDFEAWVPVWDENLGWAGKPVLGPYQRYSVQLVRTAHPSWSADKVLAQAKTEFESAGTALFVAALQHASTLRPKTLWGFYGMPRGSVGPRNATDARARALAAARTMLPVWQASGALFPSVYLNAAPAPEAIRAHRLNATVEVAIAAAEMVREAEGGAARRMPVYPFAWECYEQHEALNGSKPFLTHFDATMELISPYNEGADGLVVWGATVEAQGGANWDTYVDYIRNSTGPLIANFQRKVAVCSASHCSGHGRCTVVETGVGELRVGSDECQCFDGFSGPACATATAAPPPPSPLL